MFESGALITLGNKLLVGWGKRTVSSDGFYFPDFFLQDLNPCFSYEHTEVISNAELLERIGQGKAAKIEWEPLSPALFEREFIRLQQLFQEGALQKGVPYVFSCGKGQLDVESCLRNLLLYAKAHPVFVYGFWHEGEGILGATPELLFSLEKGRIESAAVAGTAKWNETLSDAKSQKEHRLVIEGITEALHPFGKVEVGATKELLLGELKHLKTAIAVHANDPPFSQLVKALHPTPALGAYPKERGKQWLLDYQTLLPRKRFGAPVGYWKGDVGRCYVAIRNVQWRDQALQIGAGCGVVKESEWSKEWKELNLKINATRRILAI